MCGDELVTRLRIDLDGLQIRTGALLALATVLAHGPTPAAEIVMTRDLDYTARVRAGTTAS